MAEAVYTLCLLTSLACFLLLGRAYLRTKTRVLLWSSLCFLCLAINNLLLFIDLVLLPTMEMPLFGLARNAASLVGLVLLVFGLIWDTD